MYETIVSKVCIDFAKENKKGSEYFRYNNVQTFTEFAVADILADAPAITENWNSLYAISLHKAAKTTDYDAAFFASAAVTIEGQGIEVSNGAIRLKSNVKEGKVTFTTEEKKLEVEIANYVAPPAPEVPKDVEGFTYRFFGKPATLADILAENKIVSSYNTIVSLSDQELVTIGEDGSLAAAGYFDAVTLNVALTDGSKVEIVLSNPAPVEAGETVTTADVGSFAADTKVPAGTMLVVDSNPVVPEGIVLPGTDTKAGEQPAPVFFEVSLIGPDGEPVKAGADVTLNTAIELPEAPEGQIVKVTSLKVYHIDENGDAEELKGATYALAEGRISSVSFTTTGFSLFAITYTVDFVSAEVNKAWYWPGEGSYSVADIMMEIGVTGDIESVDLVRTDDQGGSDKALYLEEREDGHYLVSEEAFVDTFVLTVVVDGVSYHFTVTDVQDGYLQLTSSNITATIASGTNVSYNATEEKYSAKVKIEFTAPTDTIKQQKKFYIELDSDIIIPDDALNTERFAIDHNENKQSFKYMTEGNKLYVFVYADIDLNQFDPTSPKAVNYSNIVTAEGDGDNLGNDDQAQRVTLNSRSMEKTVNETRWANFHEIEYIVKINQDGFKLMNNSGATYNLDDVLQFNKTSPDGHDITVMLVPGSVKLQKLVEGNTNGSSNDDADWEDYTGSWGYQFVETKDGGKRYKTITVRGIPDGMPLRLKYAYRIDVENTAPQVIYNLGKLTNTATLHGETEHSVENEREQKWSQFSDEATTVSANSLTISKVNIENFKDVLPNARFVLEKYVNSAWVIVDAISQDPSYLYTETDTDYGSISNHTVGCNIVAL